MAGEEAISYTDMDIEEAINDFCNRFIDEMSLSKTITYATRQLGFEKVIEHQRNDFLGSRLSKSSFFER